WFGLLPTLLLVTSKMTVQVPVGTVMPVNVMRPVVLAARVFGVVPTHVPVTASDAPGVDILVSVSLKVAFVSDTAFVLPSVKVIVLVPPTGIVVGLKAFVSVGAAGATSIDPIVQAPPPNAGRTSGNPRTDA